MKGDGGEAGPGGVEARVLGRNGGAVGESLDGVCGGDDIFCVSDLCESFC